MMKLWLFTLILSVTAVAQSPNISVHTHNRIRDVWTLVSLACPVAIAGRQYAVSLYEVLAANTATYALVSLIVETLRRQLHHAK
jgi:hypothetical protein